MHFKYSSVYISIPNSLNIPSLHSGRWILNHWTTREVATYLFKNKYLSSKRYPDAGTTALNIRYRKYCTNYHIIALTSHASKVMLKIFQARPQQYVNRELPGVQAGFRKGRGTTDQIANIRWIMEKEESSRKTSTSALLTMPKPLTVWITINCGKF